MPRIQHKRGTSANLASVNPTPLEGELVWDSTENAIKIGDGATAWASLAYVTATPRTHTHSADAITSGTIDYARLPVGSTTSTVCAGDDARLSDARTPTAHKASHATGGSDSLSPSDIGAAPAASPTFTGVITVSAGTAAAPALVASGDSNTGAFFPAADTFAISTAGTERVRVDSFGRLTIFATSASTPCVFLNAASNGQSLDIRGRSSDGTGIFQFSTSGGTLVSRIVNSTTDMSIRAAADGRISLAKSDGTNVLQSKSTGAVRFVPLSADPATGEAGDVYYNSASNELRYHNGSAFVGAAPAASPTFTGVITVSATSGSAGSYLPSLTFSGDANTGFGQVSGQSDTASVFTAGHERVRVDASGRVGINNTTPIVDLEIGSSSNVATRALAVRRGTAPAYIANALEGGSLATATFSINARETSAGATGLTWSEFGNTGFAAAAVRLGSTTFNSHVSFWTATAVNTDPSERVRIDHNGRLGIGTTSPASALDINSDTIRLRTAKTPASASDTGNAGDICWDASYLYICTATNTWRRIAHSTW